MIYLSPHHQVHYAVILLLAEFTFITEFDFGERVFQELVILFNLFSVVTYALKRAITNLIIPTILDPRELFFRPFMSTYSVVICISIYW
jgi:hypothetical protein